MTYFLALSGRSCQVSTAMHFCPGNSFLVTEYCPKGSLQDILEEEDLQLDQDFK